MLDRDKLESLTDRSEHAVGEALKELKKGVPTEMRPPSNDGTKAVLVSMLICAPPKPVDDPDVFLLNARTKFAANPDALALAEEKAQKQRAGKLSDFTGLQESKLSAYEIFPSLTDPRQIEAFKLACRASLDSKDLAALTPAERNYLGGGAPSFQERMKLKALAVEVLGDRKTNGVLSEHEQVYLDEAIKGLRNFAAWVDKIPAGPEHDYLEDTLLKVLKKRARTGELTDSDSVNLEALVKHPHNIAQQKDSISNKTEEITVALAPKPETTTLEIIEEEEKKKNEPRTSARLMGAALVTAGVLASAEIIQRLRGSDRYRPSSTLKYIFDTPAGRQMRPLIRDFEMAAGGTNWGEGFRDATHATPAHWTQVGIMLDDFLADPANTDRLTDSVAATRLRGFINSRANGVPSAPGLSPFEALERLIPERRLSRIFGPAILAATLGGEPNNAEAAPAQGVTATAQANSVERHRAAPGLMSSEMVVSPDGVTRTGLAEAGDAARGEVHSRRAITPQDVAAMREAQRRLVASGHGEASKQLEATVSALEGRNGPTIEAAARGAIGEHAGMLAEGKLRSAGNVVQGLEMMALAALSAYRYWHPSSGQPNAANASDRAKVSGQ